MSILLLAVIIGFAFGFVLDRVGASHPDWIMRMLNLDNLHLMKTILLAIGFSSVLMFAGLLSGIIDPGHLSVKSAYVGVLVGGALLGLGWAVAGFCPGTGLVAAASGRIDALFFVAGGLLGAFAYMVSYEAVLASGLLESIVGGKTTLGAVEGSGYGSLFTGVSGEWVGIGVGVVLMVIAALLPHSLRSKNVPAALKTA